MAESSASSEPTSTRAGQGPVSSDHAASDHAASDPLATVSLALGAVGLAIALAQWLGREIGFPGTTLHPEIHGWLAEHSYDKAPESALFFYTLVLAPILVRLAVSIGARLDSTRHVTPLAAIGGAGAAMIGGLSALGRVGPTTGLIASASVLLCGFVGAVFAPRVAAPIRRRGKDLIGRYSIDQSGTIITVGVAIGVAMLGLGDPVPKPTGNFALLVASARLGFVFMGGFATSWGIALLLDAVGPSQEGLPRPLGVGWRAIRALRPCAGLLAIRFVAESTGWVALVMGSVVLGSCVSLMRSRGSTPPSPDELARQERRFFRAIFLPGLVLALVFHDDINGTLDFYHMGEWLSTASEMLRGRIPFSDIYLQHGLIQNALRSWITFAWFEPTLELDRLSGNFSYALAHACFLWMGLQLFRSSWTALALSLALATPSLYLQPRLLGLFVALGFCLIDLKRARSEDGTPTARRSFRPLIGCGVAVALAGFWSLDSGVYGVAAISIYLGFESIGRRESWWRRPLPLVWFGIGGLLGSAPFLAWLASEGALHAFVTNSVRQASYQLSVWGMAFPPLSDLVSLLAESVPRALADGRFIAPVAAITFIGTIVALVAVGSRRLLSRFELQLVLFAVTGAMVFRTALGRSDPSHLGFVSAFLWPLLVRAGEYALLEAKLTRWRSCARWGLRATPLLILTLYLMTAFVPLFGMVRQWLRLSEQPYTVPGGGFARAPLPRMGNLLIPEWQARALTALQATVDERVGPDVPILEFSNMGAIYFFLDRPAPSRYLFPVYAATYEMQQEMVDDLEKSRPPLLVTSDVLYYDHIDGVPNSRRQPIVAQYLHEHYTPVEFAPFGTLYARTAP